MVRQSPPSRGYVPIGSVERGLDGKVWIRVEQSGTGGVWRRKSSVMPRLNSEIRNVEKELKRMRKIKNKAIRMI
tara:strand:- start:529 stop:750 length:222 start_codon:yes stop_codon:yes gene_type:complete